MRHGRNSSVEIESAQASKAEIPQECPHGSDQFLNSVIPTLLGTIEQKRPYLGGIPLAEIPTECLEHLGSAATVRFERRFSCASVVSKPIAEGNDQLRLNNLYFREGIALANTRLE